LSGFYAVKPKKKKKKKDYYKAVQLTKASDRKKHFIVVISRKLNILKKYIKRHLALTFVSMRLTRHCF
jgi:hypothetical protein